jgi:biopolymer transport protein ExbD
MDEKPLDTINVIPFVDIMLVLLTIVLTTSSLIASGRLPVKLPESSMSTGDVQQAKLIELSAAGTIYYSGKSVSPESLKAELQPLARETPFLIRADKDVSLQYFINVADVLAQLHFARVAVQTGTRR